MTSAKIALILGLGLSTAGTAPIIQEQGEGSRVFYNSVFPTGPLGQSFIAEDPLLQTIDVKLRVLNPQAADDTSFSMTLYEGLGDDGRALASRSAQPTGGPQDSLHWIGLDFSGVPLEPGNSYTFVLYSATPYWGASINQWRYPDGRPYPGAIDYPGGDLFDANYNEFSTIQDMAFRVIPVPEPGTLGLLGLGALGGLVIALLRRRRERV